MNLDRRQTEGPSEVGQFWPERHAKAVVIVTGGASGIGLACVERLSREGASVVVADLDGTVAARVGEHLGAPERSCAVTVDVRSRSDCERMVATALERFGRVTGLVNAAGIAGPKTMLVDVSPDEWDRVLDINLRGSLNVLQAVAPHLTGGASIVMLASANGMVARAKNGVYCISKAGVLMLTKVAALELGRVDVRVNAIAPGFIETPMTAETFAQPGRLEKMLQSTPLGRCGQPDDVAALASFLLSGESSYVSGELVSVDGGVAAPART